MNDSLFFIIKEERMNTRQFSTWLPFLKMDHKDEAENENLEREKNKTDSEGSYEMGER